MSVVSSQLQLHLYTFTYKTGHITLYVLAGCRDCKCFSGFVQVNPSEVWLRDEIDGTAYFPLQDENLDLQSQGVLHYATLIVVGPTVT